MPVYAFPISFTRHDGSLVYLSPPPASSCSIILLPSGALVTLPPTWTRWLTPILSFCYCVHIPYACILRIHSPWGDEQRQCSELPAYYARASTWCLVSSNCPCHGVKAMGTFCFSPPHRHRHSLVLPTLLGLVPVCNETRRAFYDNRSWLGEYAGKRRNHHTILGTFCSTIPRPVEAIGCSGWITPYTSLEYM